MTPEERTEAERLVAAGMLHARMLPLLRAALHALVPLEDRRPTCPSDACRVYGHPSVPDAHLERYADDDPRSPYHPSRQREAIWYCVECECTVHRVNLEGTMHWCDRDCTWHRVTRRPL